MVVDFHAHILPGLDHGCKDIGTSLCQIKMAQDAGVNVIVAAPHFHPGKETAQAFLSRRRQAWETLRRALPEGAPSIIPAAEVLLSDRIDRIPDLCLSGLHAILIEMPYTEWKTDTYDTIEKINDLTGGRAVIAHVDRYAPALIENLFEIGVTGQLNAAGICKLFGRRQLMRWVDRGKISAIGSDIHGTTNSYRQFARAKKILGADFERIMKQSVDLICSDRRIFIR